MNKLSAQLGERSKRSRPDRRVTYAAKRKMLRRLKEKFKRRGG